MPAVDNAAGGNRTADLTPVLITSGAEQHLTNGVWHVPKVDLLAGVQAAQTIAGAATAQAQLTGTVGS